MTLQIEQNKLSSELLERNKTQKKIKITLDSIDIFFSDNETEPLNYHFILNLLRQKITLYFGKTQDFIQKEELAYNCLAKIYSSFKRRLTLLKEQQKTDPSIKAELFFYISQFYCYIERTARNEIILYRSKNKNNTLEYREGVDYTQPLETFVGHPVYDLDDLSMLCISNDEQDELSNDENVENEESENEEERKREENNREKKVLSQYHLENIHLENELEKTEKQLQIEMFFNNNQTFTNDEKKVIIGIYNNIPKEDVFLINDIDLLLQNKYDTNLIHCELNVRNSSRKKFNDVVNNLQNKLQHNNELRNNLEKFILGISDEENQ